MSPKQARIGAVQSEYINRLRAELLSNGGADNMDLNFTEGVNLAIVIAMAHHHAPKYRDKIKQETGEEMDWSVATAELVGKYIMAGDVSDDMKADFGRDAETFIEMVLLTVMYDGVGTPDEEWWEDASVDRETFNEVFTAEPPAE